MNSGKICIAVCADTSAEMQQKAQSASAAGDVVELRLDCLSDLQAFDLKPERNYILTLRPGEQGGRNLTFEERANFWQTVNDACGADLEEDIINVVASRGFESKICSFHDFSGQGSDLSDIYKRLSATAANVVKIAIRAEDACDAIGIWKLIDRAKADNKQIIPIAMGEAGKWTRILGLAHGAYLTYASLDSGGETAPGQITAREMHDVFRVKELDESTDVYGIIAGNTSYTMSPYVHNAAFRSKGLNSVFVPLQVANLYEFMRRMVNPKTREIELNFCGFSVTNPHKQSVTNYLDEIDDAAREIGAVNTIKFVDGKLHGFNTDAPGFIQPLKAKFGDIAKARVAVVGAGGAARACIYALKNEEAETVVFARDKDKARKLADSFGITSAQSQNGFSDFDIIVNATPLGTRGNSENEAIANAAQLKDVKLVYDLVYNPQETRLLSGARIAGAETIGGFDMLMAQAARQFEIWTGVTAPLEEMAAAAQRKLDEG